MLYRLSYALDEGVPLRGNASSNWADCNFGMLGWQPIGAARASAVVRRPADPTIILDRTAEPTNLTGWKPVLHNSVLHQATGKDLFIYAGPQNHLEMLRLG